MLRVLALFVGIEQAPPSAGPDFSTSSITIEPAQPVAGEIVTLTLNIRNTGSAAASHAEVDLQLPRAGMFVDTAGPSDAIVDLDVRIVSWQVAIEAGAIHTHAVRLILPRDAGGEVVLPTMRVRQLYTGTEAWIHGEADVQTRIDAPAARVVGIGISPAGLALIALLVAALAAWTVLRALARDAKAARRATVAAVAITIAVGFWMLFASMAWRDWRAVSEFVGTECHVLDRRMRTSATTSTSSRQMPQARSTTAYRPLLALRYDVNGSTVISSGFETGSRVQIGSGAREIESFERWRIGDEVPCWYDPRDTADVVVVRGFGGAYFFALIRVGNSVANGCLKNNSGNPLVGVCASDLRFKPFAQCAAVCLGLRSHILELPKLRSASGAPEEVYARHVEARNVGGECAVVAASNGECGARSVCLAARPVLQSPRNHRRASRFDLHARRLRRSMWSRP